MVAAQSATKDAIMMLTLEDDATSVQAAATTFSTQEGLQSGAVTQRTVNGLASASVGFQATLQDGTLAGEAYFIEYDQRIFRILGYSTAEAWSGYQPAFRSSAQSFNRLTEQRALNVQPLTLTIITTDRDMTLAQFSTRYPSEIAVEQLALLNRRSSGETIPAGTRLKRVVGGPIR